MTTGTLFSHKRLCSMKLNICITSAGLTRTIFWIIVILFCSIARWSIVSSERMIVFRISHRTCSIRKGVLRKLRKIHRKSTCARALFLKKKLQVSPCNFIKKETPVKVVSWEFSEISKNTFFPRTPLGDYFCVFGL